MAKDVKQYCQSCVTCASSRPAPSHRGTRLTLSSQPQEHQTHRERANRYVLVVIDLLTRAAEIIPIPDKSAKTDRIWKTDHVNCKANFNGSAPAMESEGAQRIFERSLATNQLRYTMMMVTARVINR